MVNTDDGSVSFFNVTPDSESRSAKVASSKLTGKSEPISLVIHPNGKEALVANRATGTVSRITGIDTTKPTLTEEIDVGSEPMGIALTPKGTHAYVTDWVGGEVIVIDVAKMVVSTRIPVGGNPFALAITNDRDQDENDESVLVTQYYARGRQGLTVTEGLDTAKEGVVQQISVSKNQVTKEIPLAPISSCFSAPVKGKDVTSGCFPNQLKGITVHTAFGKTRAYVVSVGASPEGPTNFNHNVQALISVIDLDAGKEEEALTRNLNKLIKEQQLPVTGADGKPDTKGRLFINVPSGIDFVPRDDLAFAYVTSAGSNLVLRVEYSSDGAVKVGAAQAFNIKVGQNPQGLVIKHGSTKAGTFVANLISRNVSVVGFKDQVQIKTITSTDQPQDGTEEFKVWKGKTFFNTSTGIWSADGWGSCQGCHPMGLSDGVTWHFATGPRQTIAMDGQYASKDPADMRALNWTAVFDETHDFENNTRGVSGGLGAVQKSEGVPIVSPPAEPPLPAFAKILVETGKEENHQALNGSLKFITRTTTICANGKTCPDWDLIDSYVESLRTPRGRKSSLVEQGRALFEEGGCNKCHGGPKWTVSRTFYSPDKFLVDGSVREFLANNAARVNIDKSIFNGQGFPTNVNLDKTLIDLDDSDGKPQLKRQACNIRNVGTFAATNGAVEKRDDGSNAQGKNGFNPPSLLGLAVGAPYLHNGAARDLKDLFDSRFKDHTRAGSTNFAPTGAELDALIAFLLSIDETTPEFPIVKTHLLCPTDFKGVPPSN